MGKGNAVLRVRGKVFAFREKSSNNWGGRVCRPEKFRGGRNILSVKKKTPLGGNRGRCFREKRHGRGRKKLWGEKEFSTIL